MPAAALGLHYYPSGLQRYVSHFGIAAAKRAFLTARVFDQNRLQALGLFESWHDPPALRVRILRKAWLRLRKNACRFFPESKFTSAIRGFKPHECLVYEPLTPKYVINLTINPAYTMVFTSLLMI